MKREMKPAVNGGRKDTPSSEHPIPQALLKKFLNLQVIEWEINCFNARRWMEKEEHRENL